MEWFTSLWLHWWLNSLNIRTEIQPFCHRSLKMLQQSALSKQNFWELSWKHFLEHIWTSNLIQIIWSIPCSHWAVDCTNLILSRPWGPERCSIESCNSKLENSDSLQISTLFSHSEMFSSWGFFNRNSFLTFLIFLTQVTWAIQDFHRALRRSRLMSDVLRILTTCKSYITSNLLPICFK